MDWQLIESDPGLFTELVERIGAVGVEFDEVLSVDATELSQINGLYGVLLLFNHATAPVERAGMPQPDAPVWFAHQVVNNACATLALLHMVMNISVPHGEILDRLGEFTADFDPSIRGQVVAGDETLRELHNSMSSPVMFVSDEIAPARVSDEAYHYVAYVPIHGRLYELDGLQQFPIDHGPCEDFPQRVSEVLQARLASFGDNELRFSVLSCQADQRQVYSDDPVKISELEEIRARNMRQNALRRQSYAPLAILFLKRMAQSMSLQEWQAHIEKGRLSQN